MIDKKIQFQIKFYSSFITVYYYLNWSFFSYSSLWEHRTEFHFGTLKVTKLYMVQVSGQIFLNYLVTQIVSRVLQFLKNNIIILHFLIQIPLFGYCFPLGVINSSIFGAKNTFELLKNTPLYFHHNDNAGKHITAFIFKYCNRRLKQFLNLQNLKQNISLSKEKKKN